MASNPPFQVEDQTDEDFFDKLVDDDDEFKVTALSAHSFADGNDSDEVKAFANLSIGEVAAGSEESGGEGATEAKEETACGDVSAALVDGHVEESSSLVSSNSFGFNSVIEPTDAAIGTEVTSDSTINKSNASAGSGVKEVQWTAFNTDSGQISNGFGSFRDFFSELGDGAVDPPGKVEDSFNTESKIGSGSEELKTTYNDNIYNYVQYQENQAYETAMGQSADGQDLSSSQYWESLYPGWKCDPNTGQWYQVDGHDATGNVQGSFDANPTSDWAVSDGNSQVSYLQQTAQSSGGTVTESGTTKSVTNWNQLSHDSGPTGGVTNWNQVPQESGGAVTVSNWNQVSQGNNEYPAHMVFDPQYPGWYFDTIAQEWCLLETYTSSVHSTIQTHDQLNQNGIASTGTLPNENDQKAYGEYGQVDNYMSQGFSAQNQDSTRARSFSNHNQQGLNMFQSANVAKSEPHVDFSGNQRLVNDYGSTFSVNNHVSQQKSYGSRGIVPLYEKATQGHDEFTTTGSGGFVPSGNLIQHVNQPSKKQNEQMDVSNDYYGNQNSVNFAQQQFQSSHQFSYSPNAGRSSAGRPPHALVTFGFGGKLIVIKDNSSLSTSSYGSQEAQSLF